MSDIEIAREAAAKAQANADVAKMIRSGHFDDWPNVQAAMNAIKATATQHMPAKQHRTR